MGRWRPGANPRNWGQVAWRRGAPRRYPRDGDEPLMSPDHAADGRTRVALVEDDADTRQRLTASIAGQDWLVLTASWANGATALAGLAAAAPDVLLVDLGLPDI